MSDEHETHRFYSGIIDGPWAQMRLLLPWFSKVNVDEKRLSTTPAHLTPSLQSVMSKSESRQPRCITIKRMGDGPRRATLNWQWWGQSWSVRAIVPTATGPCSQQLQLVGLNIFVDPARETSPPPSARPRPPPTNILIRACLFRHCSIGEHGFTRNSLPPFGEDHQPESPGRVRRARFVPTLSYIRSHPRVGIS